MDLFEPRYTLMGNIGENEIKTGLNLQLASSSNKTLSPTRENPSGFLNWLRKSDAGEFGISTGYSQMATRDAGIDATGQVPATSIRTSRTLSGKWDKELSEYNTLSADSTYESVSYQGGGPFLDYSSQSAGLKFSRALNEKLKAFFDVSDTEFVLTGVSQSSHSVDAILGMNWKGEYVDSTLQGGQSRTGGGVSYPTGLATIHYTGSRSQLNLNVSRLVLPSGFGGFVRTDQLGSNWNYALSEYSNVGIDLTRINNTLLNNTLVFENITSSATNTGVWIDRNLTPSWKIRTYFLRRVLQGSSVGSAFSNMIGLSLTYDNSNL